MSLEYQPASEPQVGGCCFDKTGTLTSEELQLQVLPVKSFRVRNRLQLGHDTFRFKGTTPGLLHAIYPPPGTNSSLSWTAVRLCELLCRL